MASDDAADMTVNATENTWRLAGSSFTAEGHFYAAAGDCAVNMLYGLVEIPGANCDHAIFISGTENWDELHATIVDLETSEECSGHQGGEMNELKAILNHNGQVHLVGEGQ